ncbi:LCP family protein [Cryobacterium arcticum]|uniref:LCP family protein n=1 Tax=Cryobacterium arcticum TaxID=670052 RepID=UPI002006F320|nr:LCP family protein [Cryobacterium arcticum]
MSERRAQIKGIARHGRLQRNGTVRGVFTVLAASLAVLLVSTVAVGGIAVWQLSDKISSNAIDIGGSDEAAPPPNLGAFENGFNILIVGVDNDADQGLSYGERDATLNDVNILVHVSADHSNAVVVSIPRDLIVPHPECTNADTGEEFSAMSGAPMNEAMARGGLPCVVDTVEQLTGLDIPYAGLTSFSGVVQMSDAVGGVPICLTEAIDDPLANLSLPAGTSVVSGETALGFLRSRHGVGDGSDLSRISSQQIYLASLMRTVQGDGTLTDLSKLYALATAASQNIKLSTELARTDTMVSMALAIKDLDLERLVFVQYPGTTGDPDYPGKVMPTQDLADSMFAKIAADEPFSLAPTEPIEEPVVVDPPVEAPEGTVPPETVEATPEVIEGIPGRTAGDESCAQAAIG